jgi:hypothetical protein
MSWSVDDKIVVMSVVSVVCDRHACIVDPSVQAF